MSIEKKKSRGQREECGDKSDEDHDSEQNIYQDEEGPISFIGKNSGGWRTGGKSIGSGEFGGACCNCGKTGETVGLQRAFFGNRTRSVTQTISQPRSVTWKSTRVSSKLKMMSTSKDKRSTLRADDERGQKNQCRETATVETRGPEQRQDIKKDPFGPHPRAQERSRPMCAEESVTILQSWSTPE